MNSGVNSKHHLQCVCLSLSLHSAHNQNGYRVFKVHNTVFKEKKDNICKFQLPSFLVSWIVHTWEAYLKGVVNVFDTKMLNQQQEDWEGIFWQVRWVRKLEKENIEHF